MEDRPPEAPGSPVPPPPTGQYAPPPPPIQPPARPPIPWEDPARPKLAAFFETIHLMYTRTREAYERMPLTSDVLRPYLFAILVGWIGIAAGVFWQLSLRTMLQSMMSQAGGEADNYKFLSAFFTGPLTVAFAPALIAVGVLVGSLLYQLFLMMLGGAKGGFAATLRVLCYAQAAALLQIIPGCGSLLGAIVQIVFTIIGFSAVHRISTGRATAAVLLPAVLCCVCIAIAFAIGGAAMVSSFRHSMGR
jgi:hypothetical protein